MLNVIIRSAVTILIGLLLVFQRDAIIPVLVQCVGAAFIVPGIIALASFIVDCRKSDRSKSLSLLVPVTSIGSIVLGLWLLFSPLFFVELIMLLLGALLIMIGLYQTVMLFMSKKHCTVSPVFFFMPVLLILLGVFVILKPFGAASLPFLLVGIGAIIGGVSDLLSYLILRRANKMRQKIEDNIEIIDNENNI